MNRAGYDIHDRRANGLASTSNSEASLIDLDSPPASSTTPLFPALAQPLVPGTILIPQSKSDFEQESTSPDGFGEFVSVSPSLDPLAAGPGQFSPFSPRPQSNTFAEGAQKRSDENGRRVLEEIDEFEKRGNPSDPSYFPSLAGWDQADDTKLSSSFSELESSLAEASAESVFHHKASPRPRRYSSISRSPTVLSPTLPPPPPIVQSVEVLRDPPSPELSTSSSPPLTQRLSRTLPRKWSSFFSNPGTQPAETHHTSSPPIPAAFISHSSPFAAQPYIPPTGAPGFTGDKNWDKGFAFTEVEKAGNSVKLLARSENTIPVLDTSTADLVCLSLQLSKSQTATI